MLIHLSGPEPLSDGIFLGIVGCYDIDATLGELLQVLRGIKVFQHEVCKLVDDVKFFFVDERRPFELLLAISHIDEQKRSRDTKKNLAWDWLVTIVYEAIVKELVGYLEKARMHPVLGVQEYPRVLSLDQPLIHGSRPRDLELKGRAKLVLIANKDNLLCIKRG